LAWLNASRAPSSAREATAASVPSITVPAWQSRNDQNDAKKERAREAKERLQRLVAGLRAEVNAAIDAARMHRETAEQTLAHTAIARQAGQTVVENTLPPGSIALTDAVVYRALAPELGHFPAEIVGHIVLFYSNVFNVERLVGISNSTASALEMMIGFAPRVQMNGTILIEMLRQVSTGWLCSQRRPAIRVGASEGYRKAGRVPT
jgi:hypothetical protein